jgi:hypothetical protein
VATIRALLLAAAIVPAAGLLAGEPERAEYAVRWDPAEGGPANLQELLSLLGASESAGRAYEVRYFELPRPANAPPDAIVILRQRTREDGKAEVRLKYRSTQPLPESWACPDGARFEKEQELDVSFAASPEPARVYAYSCTLVAKAPPPALGATPKSCAARMVRYEFEGDKIEEWTLPVGGVRLEVSRAAPNGPEQLAKFGELVERLRARGVKPLDETKTEFGSRCPEVKVPSVPTPEPR